jgi:hypothetical protein
LATKFILGSQGKNANPHRLAFCIVDCVHAPVIIAVLTSFSPVFQPAFHAIFGD